MIEVPITLHPSSGLEVRQIALMVQEASHYASTIYLHVNEKKINAKSIMGMMSLSLQDGQTFTVVAEGDDEVEAAKGMERFFNQLSSDS